MARKKPSSTKGLLEDPGNPRVIDEDAAAALGFSIDSFGDISGIVFNLTTGQLVAGHQRLSQLRAKHGELTISPDNGRGLIATPTGDTFIVRYVSWSEAKQHAANIAANSETLTGRHDMSKLAVRLDGLQLSSPDEVAGLRLGEIELKITVTPEADDKFDDVPELEDVEPTTKPGDIWKLGDHRLKCGSCTDSSAMDQLCADDQPWLVVTSPPYNVGKDYADSEDNLKKKDYLAFIEEVLSTLIGYVADGGFVAWNIGVSPRVYPFDHARLLEQAGFSYYRQIIWDKCGVPLPTWQVTDGQHARKYHPNWVHEAIYLFSHGEPKPGDPHEVDDKYSKDIWKIHAASATRDLKTIADRPGHDVARSNDRSMKVKEHPAAFPIALPEACIKHLTAAGEAVLDPFGGTGTTLMACERLGRKARLMELSPQYCDIIVRRFEGITGKKAELAKLD